MQVVHPNPIYVDNLPITVDQKSKILFPHEDDPFGPNSFKDFLRRKSQSFIKTNWELKWKEFPMIVYGQGNRYARILKYADDFKNFYGEDMIQELMNDYPNIWLEDEVEYFHMLITLFEVGCYIEHIN